MRFERFLVIALLTGLCSFANAQERRPNILFVLADDHALEAIGAYGSWLKPYVKTPTIDGLAAAGMRFENFCCNDSICSPSRASILTGQYNHVNGVPNLGGAIWASSPMFSEELRKAGYQTAVFGKWHLSSDPRGFDAYAITRGQGSYFNPDLETPGGKQEKFNGYYADVYTDLCLDWLRKREASKPFLLCLHFKGPHYPYDYPERQAGLLEGVTVPEPPTLHEDVAKTSPRLKNARGQLLDDPRNGYYERQRRSKTPPMDPPDATDHSIRASAAYQHMIHKYLRAVAAIDENLARVLGYLKEQGTLDNTLVIYTADQGYWLGQHGLYDKRLILEESLKMPLIVRYPKLVQPGTVDRHLCSNVDFAPTILEFAGVPVPAAMQGRSFLPLLEGKSPGTWRQAIWYAYWEVPPHWGIRTDRYTLVRFPGTDEIEFYDLQKDPLQKVSVHGDPAYAEAIRDMQQLLVRTMAEVKIKPEQLPSADGKNAPSSKSQSAQKKEKKKSSGNKKRTKSK